MQIRLMAVGSARSDPPHFQQALGRAGVKVVAGSVSGASCPALVYFNDASPELVPAVRRLGATGQRGGGRQDRGSDLSCDQGGGQSVDGGAGGQRVLVVAGRGATITGDLAWELVRAGASDVISWDGCDDPVRAVVSRLERWLEVDEIVAGARDTLVGIGPRWTGLLRQVVEVARFTEASILLTGESGTGKEMIARLIHQLDIRRKRKDLVVLDCATVVPTLSGSEFFGHEKGAFTGATGPRDGAFALADGGMLFLDEVGELPPNLQAELLRVIQEGMYKRVGSNTWHTTDFRLISATNRDLAADQRSGRFRLDLYYRIAAWQFRLPPLRERREDIEPLARSFLARSRPPGTVPDFDPAVRAFLLSRDYPGNVRDLLQLVERISQRHVGVGPVSVGDVPDDDRPPASAAGPAAASQPRHIGIVPLPNGEPVASQAPRAAEAPRDAHRAPGHHVQPDGPWHVGAFETAVRQALHEGADLKEITKVAAETAISVALDGSDGSLAQAARSLGVTPRALQLRRAAGRLSRAVESADQRRAGNGQSTTNGTSTATGHGTGDATATDNTDAAATGNDARGARPVIARPRAATA